MDEMYLWIYFISLFKHHTSIDLVFVQLGALNEEQLVAANEAYSAFGRGAYLLIEFSPTIAI